MFYSPETYRMWDTWMYYHNKTYYLYYLCGPYNRELNLFPKVTYNDLIYRNAYFAWILGRYMAEAVGHYVGLATSKDGVFWKEYGTVLTKSKKDTWWMGTGSIWPSENFIKDKKFIMNYSEWRPAQTIFFAESTDLIHWNKLGDKYAFEIDDRWYRKGGKEDRWDCIATVPKPEGGRYGYWTADLKPSVAQFGFGFGYTKDGIHWKALEPPKINWELHQYSKPKFSMEIIGIGKIGKYYYGICHIGEFANCTFMSADPQGPFWPSVKNFFLLAGSCTNCVRFFQSPDGPLLHYTAWDQYYKKCYFPPLKKPLIDKEGNLRIGWWDGNNKLKDKIIKVKVDGKSNDSKINMLTNKFDTKKGIVLEGSLDLTECDTFVNDKVDILSDEGKEILKNESTNLLSHGKFTGIYIEYDNDIGTAFLIDARGVSKYGSVKSDSTDFRCEGHINREFNFSNSVRIKLLLKEVLMELYIDDILIQAHTMLKPATGKIGIITNNKKEVLKTLKVWESL